MATSTTPVVGEFDNIAAAECAVDELRHMGFRDDQIHFIEEGGEFSSLPEEEARRYRDALNDGRILVIVHGDDRADVAHHILRHNGSAETERPEIGILGTGLPSTPY